MEEHPYTVIIQGIGDDGRMVMENTTAPDESVALANVLHARGASKADITDALVIDGHHHDLIGWF